MRSLRDNCCKGSYAEIEWGARLEILKKLKNANNIAALHI